MDPMLGAKADPDHDAVKNILMSYISSPLCLRRRAIPQNAASNPPKDLE